MLRLEICLLLTILAIHYGDSSLTKNCKYKGVQLKIRGKKIMKTNTAQMCEERCAEKSGCIAWNWKPDNKGVRNKLRKRCIFFKASNLDAIKTKGWFCGEP